MTRIDRADTLFTELRDLKRRLRLLEAARMRPTTPVTGLSVPLPPVRPSDWPSTASADWELIADTSIADGQPAVTLVLRVVTGAGTIGEARVVLDGVPVGTPLRATQETTRRSIEVQGRTVAVEGRRISGDGPVRISAAVRLPGRPATSA